MKNDSQKIYEAYTTPQSGIEPMVRTTALPALRKKIGHMSAAELKDFIFKKPSLAELQLAVTALTEMYYDRGWEDARENYDTGNSAMRRGTVGEPQ